MVNRYFSRNSSLESISFIDHPGSVQHSVRNVVRQADFAGEMKNEIVISVHGGGGRKLAIAKQGKEGGPEGGRERGRPERREAVLAGRRAATATGWLRVERR